MERLTWWERLKDWVHGEFLWFDRFLKAWAVRLIVIGAHTAVLVAACYVVMWWFAMDQIYSDPEQIPFRTVGLVPGTSSKYHGRDNAFFTARIKAAALLYAAEKVKYLIVSGGRDGDSDEPTEMKSALVAKGVPADHIYCDYAGNRTLDTVLRAQSAFGQEDFTIISQRFQNERALYFARRHGMMDTVAFNAANAPLGSTLKMYFREIPARAVAVVQVEFFGLGAAQSGPKVAIGPSTPPVDLPPPAGK